MAETSPSLMAAPVEKQTEQQTARQPTTVPLARLVFMVGAFLFMAFVFVLVQDLKTPGAPNSVAFDEAKRMNECREQSLDKVRLEKVDVISLAQISDFCYTEIRREFLMGNYNLHRFDLVRQNFQTLVVMWMVVTITMSGVVLAGVQLIAAFRLASPGQGSSEATNELIIKRGEISLKSSVTGLMILAVSLAFFIVYVKWVYTLTPDQYGGEAVSAEPIISAPTSNAPAQATFPSTAVPAALNTTFLPGLGHAGAFAAVGASDGHAAPTGK